MAGGGGGDILQVAKRQMTSKLSDKGNRKLIDSLINVMSQGGERLQVKVGWGSEI